MNKMFFVPIKFIIAPKLTFIGSKWDLVRVPCFTESLNDHFFCFPPSIIYLFS